MSFRPAVPPRRATPSVSTSPGASHDNEEPEEKPLTIAERMAKLRSAQVAQGEPRPPDAPRENPPVVPRRQVEKPPTSQPLQPTISTVQGAHVPTQAELDARGAAFLKLIRRPVPPIPGSQPVQNDPQAPPRPVPPLPTHPLTPPPEETGPKPADELELVSTSCLKCHDFAFIDYHASLFPRNDVVSLEALATDLTSPFGTETEKARAIFAWMHHNVAYDTASFFSGNLRAMSPEDTLRSGLAVCDGYAGLFAYLAEFAGLQAHKVNGHGKGLGYKATQPGAPPPAFTMNHAWNCVLMDGEWRLIDCCWGAGAVDGTNYVPRLTTMWFGSDAAEFGRRHFPEDEGYQLLAEPMNWEDYILEPPGPTIFGVFYEHNFDPYMLQPAASEVQGGEWASVQLFKICEHMSTAEEDNYVYLMATPDGNQTPLRVNEYGGWSAEVWIPAGSGELSLYYVTKLGEQDGKGLSIDYYLSARKATHFGGLARWTIV